MKRPGHGGNLAWAAEVVGCSPNSILDFSASINPLGPPRSAIAAIHNQLNDISTYPDPGYWRLRVALGQFHGVDPTWILPGNGSAELLTWASRDLAVFKTTCLMSPGFGDYGRSLQAFEAHTTTTSLIDTDSLYTNSCCQWLKSVRKTLHSNGLSPKDCGLLLNNPHNPTGKIFRKQDLYQAVETFGLVVLDEAFMDFLHPDTQPEAKYSFVRDLQNYPNLVILRSLTKFYSLPGLRLGYAIGHPERMQQWRKWRDPWPVNTLAEAAALAVLKDKTFQNATWQWLDDAKPKLVEGLGQLPGLTVLPGAANFLLIKTATSATTIQEFLLRHHKILIRDCISFPELGDHYFRIAVRTCEDNQKLLKGLTFALKSSRS